MIGINADRIRSLVSECHTEPEVVAALRSHKIKYTYTTETGTLSIKVPCRKGSVRIYRTCSKASPFMVHTARSSGIYPIPVLHNDY